MTPATLPPDSPERDPVETVWQVLRQNRLANRLFDPHDAIVDACCAASNDPIALPDAVTSITAGTRAQITA